MIGQKWYNSIDICQNLGVTEEETYLKKIVGLALSVILVTSLASCKSQNIRYKNGSYEGSAQGHIGLIKVKIVIDKYKIKEIIILEQQETPILAEIVYKKIPPKVIESNSSEVEVVAGATYTSKSLINAIKDGLDKAKIKQQWYEVKCFWNYSIN